MSDVLVVIYESGAEPSRSDLSAIGFGRTVAEKISGACDVVVVGPAASGLAEKLADYGVHKVFVAENAVFAQPTGEARTEAIAAAAAQGNYRLICGVNGTATRDSFPRVAARLGAAMASDVLAIGDCTAEALSFTRPSFSGNLLCDLQLRTPTAVATCRGSSFEPAAAGAAGTVETLALPETLNHPRKHYVELNKTVSERPELTEADVIISGGRGTRGEEGFKLIEELADLVGAAVGASRAVVDAGWMPNDMQVGQTGKIVAPKLYVAVGMSGAIQHLAGMRNSKTIVAINKDPQAPIFEVADIGLVADLFEAVPALTAKVRARG